MLKNQHESWLKNHWCFFFSDRFSTIFFWHLSTNKGKYFIFSSWQQAGFIRLGNSLVVRNSYSQTVAHKHKWFWDSLWWKAPALTALVDTSTAAVNAVRAAVMKGAVWIQRSSGWQQMFGFFLKLFTGFRYSDCPLSQLYADLKCVLMYIWALKLMGGYGPRAPVNLKKNLEFWMW